MIKAERMDPLELAARLEQHKADLKAVSRFLFENPEPGLREFKAAMELCRLLNAKGFHVEAPFGGLDTAFRASYGKGGPCVCFMAEYDALPGLGHACGHPLIAASAVAAGILVKEALENAGVIGRVVVMGTPGEEDKAGKVSMIGNGAFEGIDAALTSHPMRRTSTDSGCLSLSRYRIAFHGKSAHASLSPELGVNALDAAIQLFNGVSAWRQQLPESARVHGVIVHGGEAPNIIPDFAECLFNVRAEDEEGRLAMEGRLTRIAEAAAAMAECRAEIFKLSSYKASVYNQPLNESYFACASSLGMEPVFNSSGGRISSDFGDVSQIMPAANLHFGIGSGENPLHSEGFLKAASSERAFAAAMSAGAAMAAIGARFLSDHEFRSAVAADFMRRSGLEASKETRRGA